MTGTGYMWAHVASLVTHLAYVPYMTLLWMMRARYHVAFSLAVWTMLNSVIYHVCYSSEGSLCTIDLTVSSHDDTATAEFGFVTYSVIALRIESVMVHNMVLILMFVFYTLLRKLTGSIFVLIGVQAVLLPVVFYRGFDDSYNKWYFVASLLVSGGSLGAYYAPQYTVFHPIWHVLGGAGLYIAYALLFFSEKNLERSILQLQNPKSLIVNNDQQRRVVTAM